MRSTIAAILFAATATASIAQNTPPTGAVKRTAEGVCLEPGHPFFETALAVSTHPTMRDCVLSGGRRDTLPSEPTEVSPKTDPEAPGPAPAQAGMEPLASSQTTTATNPLMEPLSSTQKRANAQPGAPKGIALPVQPSYSETPGLFRPPEDYFGRGPTDFEP